MGRHENPAVIGTITSQALKEKTELLKTQLSLDLHTGFEKEVGYPIPSAEHAQVLCVTGTAAEFSDSVEKTEFLAGARKLLGDRFDLHSPLGTWVMEVAAKAIDNVLDGADQDKQAHGYHETYEDRTEGQLRKLLFAAAYASTRLCNHQEWGTEHDFYLSEYVFTVFNTPLQAIVGKYECHLYDHNPALGAKNDMHYVTISRVEGSDAELWWENRAGMKWKLAATPDRRLLTVDPSSYVTQHYNSKTVQVVWNGDQVTGLHGANDELYTKESG